MSKVQDRVSLEHVEGYVLNNVHPVAACAGQRCPVHRRTEHSMRSFPQNFRSDTGLMERICKHGIGHPDPDGLDFFDARGQDMRVHGCDGCCSGAYV